MNHRSLSSGCSLCATTSQCSTAYRNSPGQFCGNWFDMSTSSNKPCCCPLNSVCKVSSSQCICHVERSSNNFIPASPHKTPFYDGYHHENEKDFSLGFFLFLVIVVVCCCWCFRQNRDEHTHHHVSHCEDEHTPMAQAYPIQSDPSCPAQNPAYKEYGSSVHHDNTGVGVGTAIVSGLGGLVAGTMIGDMIGRNSAEIHAAERFGGGTVGGGYDVVGGSGGYDIVGDSGDADDGYDIQGDS
ncbi:hypothetical protein ACHAW6_011915 [Cyclotella cf. meneghiniana]